MEENKDTQANFLEEFLEERKPQRENTKTQTEETVESHKKYCATKVEDVHRRVPTADISYEAYDPKNLRNWGDYVDTHSEKKELTNSMDKANFPFLIEGDKGIGKTLLVHSICRETNTPLVELRCSSGTKKRDLIGSPQIDVNGSYFELGVLPTAFEVANHFGKACLYIDEINACEHEVQKIFNPVLDGRKSIRANGVEYRLDEGCKLCIVATMNPITYAGVNTLTEDLTSRFIGDVWAYPSKEELDLILDWKDIPIDTVRNPLLTMAQDTHSLRMKGDVEYVLSPRDIQQFIQRYKELAAKVPTATVGGRDEKAVVTCIKQCIIFKFRENTERELMRVRCQETFGVTGL
jgi:MoxR-like ATPase